MKLIYDYMKKYQVQVIFNMFLKFSATVVELMIPYILEHIIDDIVPLGQMRLILIWGMGMILLAFAARTISIWCNRRACRVARDCIIELRQDLFEKTCHLSGARFDAFGLPSLISRMTSDSYNVQDFISTVQTMTIHAPIMLIGGIIVTMIMDWHLSLILCSMLPLLLAIVLGISMKGIPMYRAVQEKVDAAVRIMRENITGIRVVKALSKADYEKRRFSKASQELAEKDIKVSVTMAIPGPAMQLFLNTGLTLVVIVGASRVNGGQIKPGVILSFLTYFNMILQSVMALNRIFVRISKASASAGRIARILDDPEDQLIKDEEECPPADTDAHILFDHVDFSYEAGADIREFTGGERERCLTDIHFSLKRGESLGIIGSTGCGKTTIINLLMRFYDVDQGGIYIDGRNVNTYDKDELRRKFGVVFQNDIVFADSLRENIVFGREMTEERLREAAYDAMAGEFIDSLEEGFDYRAAIKGANLSGGQKQRVLISRALAARPEILILDDASSALDYKTDASLRAAIRDHYEQATTIIVAQRISSLIQCTAIAVMEEGRIIGLGTHEELMKTCPVYREMYEIQMGALA